MISRILPWIPPLKKAIEEVDRDTLNFVAYYMINCAHPSHFMEAFSMGELWRNRIRGVRVNASDKSHEELDGSETLDAGNPLELGSSCADLFHLLPNLNVVGGCCGTDITHIIEISKVCSHIRWSA